MKKANEFFIWSLLNIVLPISPLATKASINFFTDDQISKIPILDGIELIYYNLFLCVTMINLLSGKKMFIENLMRVGLILICSLDFITLILFYLKLDNNKCLVYSKIMLFLVPTALAIYKYRTIEGMEVE